MYQEKVLVNRRGRRKTAWTIFMMVLLCWIFISVTVASEESVAVPVNATAFDLKDISIFDAPDYVRQRLMYGVVCPCLNEPDEGGRRYPEFKSEKPLYGSFTIGGSREEPGIESHYAFVLDESGGTGKRYDLMYIDVNLNNDLTDDSPRRVAKDVPDHARIQSSSITAQAIFESVAVRITSQEGKEHQLEMMPRYFAYGAQRTYAALMPAKVRMGTIQIGSKKLDAVLGHSRGVFGAYDHPDTNLFLLPADDSSARSLAQWYGGDTLKALHRMGDTFYRVTTTAGGDKLFVQPYQGPLGVLEIKAGSRDVKAFTVAGSLISQNTAVSLAEELGTRNGSRDTYRLPVGDYRPMLLNITCDNLHCLTLRNSHADGSLGGRSEIGPPDYGIKIREGKPFVIDFSDKPKVIFASPAKGYRVSLGGQLDVKAVLTHPSLDIMFRQIRANNDQLNPKVTIARSDGEVVAEGVMPFG